MTEERKEYMKKYRAENKEKIAAQTKAYRENNSDWLKENKRKSDANRRANGKTKEWEASNKDKRKEYNKRYLLKLSLKNAKITARTLNSWSTKIKTSQSSCVICRETNNLEAHHILPKSKYPEYALSFLNGITLCKECHKTVHMSTTAETLGQK